MMVRVILHVPVGSWRCTYRPGSGSFWHLCMSGQHEED